MMNLKTRTILLPTYASQLKKGDRFTHNGKIYEAFDFKYNPTLDYELNVQINPGYLLGAPKEEWIKMSQKTRIGIYLELLVESED